VHADGAPRAALYGFERGGRFSYYQSGSDPDWRRRSVGTVVVGAALEDAFARGSKEFDFLRGLERYKTLYTPCVRELVTLQVATGPRARAVRVVDRGQLLGTATARRVLPVVRGGLRGWKPPVSR
jgi:CelD/BcsL family acetyltransferase involved in cellulose biosynthesis